MFPWSNSALETKQAFVWHLQLALDKGVAPSLLHSPEHQKIKVSLWPLLASNHPPQTNSFPALGLFRLSSGTSALASHWEDDSPSTPCARQSQMCHVSLV